MIHDVMDDGHCKIHANSKLQVIVCKISVALRVCSLVLYEKFKAMKLEIKFCLVFISVSQNLTNQDAQISTLTEKLIKIN